MNTPKFIVIHHSWSPDRPVERDWDAITKYHIEVNGWSKNGYHFGLDYVNKLPRVMIGRPVTESGAHALGFNDRSIGICVIGNYDLVTPPADKWHMLVRLCSTLIFIHHIPIDNIIGHRDTYDMRNVPREKTCPGNLFDLVKLRKDVSEN